MFDANDANSVSYQFSGYNLPMLQLDSTGDAYYIVQPHPYYYNQPEYWTKPAYKTTAVICRGEDSSDFAHNVPSNFELVIEQNTQKLYGLTNF